MWDGNFSPNLSHFYPTWVTLMGSEFLFRQNQRRSGLSRAVARIREQRVLNAYLGAMAKFHTYSFPCCQQHRNFRVGDSHLPKRENPTFASSEKSVGRMAAGSSARAAREPDAG